MIASSEVTFALSWTGVYLIIFILVHILQSGIIAARKKGKKFADKNMKKGSMLREPTRKLLDPNIIWMKVPFFIILFAIIGIIEAHLRYAEHVGDETLFLFGSMSVFFMYLIMLATIREDRFKVTFSILMGGLFAVFIAHYLTSLIYLQALGK